MKSLTKQYKNFVFYPWLVISFSALFLFYKYVLQVSPSVMTEELMQHFHLDGAGLGNLAAMYFYTYLIVQIFAGPLLDRFSPRKLTSFAIAVAGMGAILFSAADTLLVAWIARACIGIGAAFATVSYMKMATNYFPPKKFAFIGGLLATAAMLGSMGGEAPLAFLVKYVGWEQALFYCGLVGFIIAILFLAFVKDRHSTVQTATSTIRWQDLLSILKQKHNWLLMFYSGLAFTPLAVFGGLWGNPFLHTAYGVSTTQAATLTSFMFFGLAVGGPLFGYLSDKLQNRFGMMLSGLMLSFVAISIVLYSPGLNYFALAILLFLFGLGTGAFMLGFAMGRELNNLALMATVVSLINTGDAIFGAFSEPLVGKLLDVFWSGKTLNGIEVFSLMDFHLSLAILPLYLLLALFFLLCLKYVKP